MDKDKIIKGLEFTKAMITFNPSTGEDIEPGNLNEENKTTYDACVGAIALLKEQEAELSFREPKAITHTATKLDDATCPSCGNVVGEKIRTGAIGQSVVQVRWNYCRFCGQKLDWEGR